MSPFWCSLAGPRKTITLRLLLGLGLLLLTIPGSAQNLQGSGNLTFPASQLNGTTIELPASSAPFFEMEWLATFPSLQLTFSATDLTSPQGRTLPASLLRFTSQNGTFITLDGDPIEAVQVESQQSASLDATVLVLSVPAGLQGRWRYLPKPSNFTLKVPAEAYAGTYQGTLTATIVGGP